MLWPMTTTPDGLPGAGDRYLTAETIAAELGIHVQTAQQFFRTGGLPGRKVGHRWTTTREAFDAWMISGPIPGDDEHPPAGTTLPPLETKD